MSFLTGNQWNLLSVKKRLVNQQLPFIPSTNVLYYSISFFPGQSHDASQETRSLTVCSCFNKGKACTQRQSSTPTLPGAPPQSLIHDAEEVPPFPAVSTGPPRSSAQSTVTQPSLDIAQLRYTITASVLQNYTLLVSSPSPPLPIQM